MDEPKTLEDYLQLQSDKELAEIINFAFQQEFNEIDPDFQLFYQKELDRLRAFDALRAQILILKKEKSKIKKYLKDEQKYQIIMDNLDKVEQMYYDWKNSLTEEDIMEISIID